MVKLKFSPVKVVDLNKYKSKDNRDVKDFTRKENLQNWLVDSI